MADVYLHLLFARRLRFAQGLHPLVGETFTRCPSLVTLGAALTHLPAHERSKMGFLRRLFAGGNELLRWQKMLVGASAQGQAELIAGLALPDDSTAGGSMSCFALSLGALASTVLEESTKGLIPAGGDVAALERAQARIWATKAIPSLMPEWGPILDIDKEPARKMLPHVDWALSRVFGQRPTEAALGRWTRALTAEVAPLAQKGSLPASAGVSDDAASATFDPVALIERTQSAVAWFVALANRLAEAIAEGATDRSTLVSMVLANGALARPGHDDDADAQWRGWLRDTREKSLARGRNPKPAFVEGQSASDHMLPSATLVMNAAALPPVATSDAGAPPVPETSGPVPRPPVAPGASDGFVAPAKTQEVTVGEIEELAAAPPLTQEVSLAQIEAITSKEGEAVTNPAGTPGAVPLPGKAPPPPPTTSGEGPAASPSSSDPPRE